MDLEKTTVFEKRNYHDPAEGVRSKKYEELMLVPLQCSLSLKSKDASMNYYYDVCANAMLCNQPSGLPIPFDQESHTCP